jgi:hypothetical protein
LLRYRKGIIDLDAEVSERANGSKSWPEQHPMSGRHCSSDPIVQADLEIAAVEVLL